MPASSPECADHRSAMQPRIKTTGGRRLRSSYLSSFSKIYGRNVLAAGSHRLTAINLKSFHATNQIDPVWRKSSTATISASRSRVASPVSTIADTVLADDLDIWFTRNSTWTTQTSLTAMRHHPAMRRLRASCNEQPYKCGLLFFNAALERKRCSALFQRLILLADGTHYRKPPHPHRRGVQILGCQKAGHCIFPNPYSKSTRTTTPPVQILNATRTGYSCCSPAPPNCRTPTHDAGTRAGSDHKDEASSCHL